jgi:hypothetical protein
VSAFVCTTCQLHPSSFCQKNYLKFSLRFPAGHMEHLKHTAAPSTLLGTGSTKQGAVSLLFGFHLHYFSALSDNVLPKEISQIFAPIPGGAHATSRAVLFLFCRAPWRSTTAHSATNVSSETVLITFLKFLCSNSRRGTCYLQLSLLVCLEIQYEICDAYPALWNSLCN